MGLPHEIRDPANVAGRGSPAIGCAPKIHWSSFGGPVSCPKKSTERQNTNKTWWGWRDSKPQKRWRRFARTCVPMRVHGPLLRLPDFGPFRSRRRETQVYEASLSLIVPHNADHDGNVARDAETDSRVGSDPRSAEAGSAPTVAYRDRSDEVHDRKRGAWAPAHGIGGEGVATAAVLDWMDGFRAPKYFPNGRRLPWPVHRAKGRRRPSSAEFAARQREP
jgi:hypothetical protein